jgi:hypothetical protein
MRKTLALLLATAFVATLPSLASAKTKRHHPRRAPVAQVVDSNESGPRLVGNALYQILVPWQVTFAPRVEPVEPRIRMKRRARRHAAAS